MNLKPLMTSVVATLLAGAATFAAAQNATATKEDPSLPPKAPEWTTTDTNRDGYLTKEELIPFPSVIKRFEEIDTDRDGRISEAEYRTWIENGKKSSQP